MEIEKQRDKLTGTARWLSLAGGCAAVYWGLKRRSWTGSALALAGAAFAARGVTGERDVLEYLGLRMPAGSLPYGNGIKIRRSVTIAKPAEELYRFWRDLANLPLFLRHVRSITVIDERHSHWIASGPVDRPLEWDAEISVDRPGDIIGWRSVTGPVEHAGSVRFEPAPGERGTVVRVQLQYNPPGGRIGAAVAKLLGRDPDRQVLDDLRRFKQLMEAGEIPTVEGQPTGPTRWLPRRADIVEETSVESFPASDAPAWTAGGGVVEGGI